MYGSSALKEKQKMNSIIWDNDKGAGNMHIIDQSEHRTIAMMQIFFWGALSLVTLRKSDGINDRLQKAREEYKEASSKDRI